MRYYAQYNDTGALIAIGTGPCGTEITESEYNRLLTEIRQKAIRALPRDCDALIVLGSSASNNSRKLAEIGREIGLESHLVLDAEGLAELPLGKYRKIALAAGASTPPECFKRALDYLRSLP